MRDKLRATTDLQTGKRFMWNEISLYYGLNVPTRTSARKTTFLHPHRVTLELLRELNPTHQFGPVQYTRYDGKVTTLSEDLATPIVADGISRD